MLIKENSRSHNKCVETVLNYISYPKREIIRLKTPAVNRVSILPRHKLIARPPLSSGILPCLKVSTTRNRSSLWHHPESTSMYNTLPKNFNITFISVINILFYICLSFKEMLCYDTIGFRYRKDSVLKKMILSPDV